MSATFMRVIRFQQGTVGNCCWFHAVIPPSMELTSEKRFAWSKLAAMLERYPLPQTVTIEDSFKSFPMRSCKSPSEM